MPGWLKRSPVLPEPPRPKSQNNHGGDASGSRMSSVVGVQGEHGFISSREWWHFSGALRMRRGRGIWRRPCRPAHQRACTGELTEGNPPRNLLTGPHPSAGRARVAAESRVSWVGQNMRRQRKSGLGGSWSALWVSERSLGGWAAAAFPSWGPQRRSVSLPGAQPSSTQRSDSRDGLALG